MCGPANISKVLQVVQRALSSKSSVMKEFALKTGGFETARNVCPVRSALMDLQKPSLAFALLQLAHTMLDHTNFHRGPNSSHTSIADDTTDVHVEGSAAPSALEQDLRG